VNAIARVRIELSPYPDAVVDCRDLRRKVGPLAVTHIDKIMEAARAIELWTGRAGTGAIISAFEKLGRDLGYEVGTGWLYDMYWCTQEQGKNDKFLTSIPMVLESEFNKLHGAQQPPWEGCRAASKIEYESAERDFLLHTSFGAYAMTGHWWRRYYWYCHL
jgi:hypothetical protein